VAAQGLCIERCKPKTKTAAESGVAEHVHNATQHTRAIAEAELASTDGASAHAQVTEDMMHDIADLIYKRFLKGKGPPPE
jgi:hypothetical protein